MKSGYKRGPWSRTRNQQHGWIILTPTILVVVMMTMRYWEAFGFLFVLCSLITASPAPHQRCKGGDACWPSPQEWEAFNSSINGLLIHSYPSAAVCHRDQYSEELCAVAKEHWTDSFWRTSQPGAYSAIVWELGQDQCFINKTIDSPCDQGRVGQYSLNASSMEDIQAGVRFASEKNLYLVIKNTGHDHLGCSSGEASFCNLDAQS